MNNLLMDEYPLLVMPKLATKIGLNEAIILQQIHYWLEINKKTNNNFKDNVYWTYNTYEEWKEQFPFWSIPTIKRTILKLQKLDLLIVGNYNKMKIDKTKWYTINYETLETLTNTESHPSYQNDTSSVSNCTIEEVKMIQAIPENTAEISTKTNIIGNFDKQNPTILFSSLKPSIKPFNFANEFEVYIKHYYNLKGKEKYTEDNWFKMYNEFVASELCYESASDIRKVVKQYLKTKFEKHSLFHSLSEKIIVHRMQELNLIGFSDVTAKPRNSNKSKANNVEQCHNFKQRDYDDDEFEQFYS